MKYVRMPIEIESPEQMGYASIQFNLTESSVSDVPFEKLQLDLKKLVLAYGDHNGLPELRELLSNRFGNFSADDVLITVGAAAALYIVNTSLLNPGDEILVMHPNYGTNIETPKAMGVNVRYIELKFENGFRTDFTQIEKQINSRTKLISITNPHNPTGVCLSADELNRFVQFAEKNNCYLLVDETYRELQETPLPLAASLSEKVISVSSLSKAYGMPGLRMGWIITKNKSLQEIFLAAKEQIFVCNSLLDETIALQFLQQHGGLFPEIKNQLLENRKILFEYINNETRLEWIVPTGGVVCFPRIKKEANINSERFYKALNQELFTYVGPGHWFDMDKRYMRIGYGWPQKQELIQGLSNLSIALDRSIN